MNTERKPFTLALAIMGKPLVTRDGRKATRFKRSGRRDGYDYQVYVGRDRYCVTDQGTEFFTMESDKDLFMA